MRTWVKLYTEILRDPKMHALPDHCFRVCVNLIALAGQLDLDGKLGTTEEVAFHLRLDPHDALLELEELQKVRVTSCKRGVWSLKNWDVRNGKAQSDTRTAVRERVQKHRQNKAIPDATTTNGNADVTPLQDGGNAPREEEIREEEIREEERREEADGADAPATQADPKERLLILNPILQEQLARYHGEGRRVPRHYQSDQMREAYEKVFLALGDELPALTEKAFSRQMSSLPKLLAWLEGCATKKKSGYNGNGYTKSMPAANGGSKYDGMLAHLQELEARDGK